MLFTENRYDRSMEQMMKGIPNFYPRGSGIVVTGNFRYTAEMCDCEYCGYYGGKKWQFGSLGWELSDISTKRKNETKNPKPPTPKSRIIILKKQS